MSASVSSSGQCFSNLRRRPKTSLSIKELRNTTCKVTHLSRKLRCASISRLKRVINSKHATELDMDPQLRFVIAKVARVALYRDSMAKYIEHWFHLIVRPPFSYTESHMC